jgi:hypothetical protein
MNYQICRGAYNFLDFFYYIRKDDIIYLGNHNNVKFSFFERSSAKTRPHRVLASIPIQLHSTTA